jgi:ppGpp synthetase/RelA/SpoT-type nucleotidyltranferase
MMSRDPERNDDSQIASELERFRASRPGLESVKKKLLKDLPGMLQAAGLKYCRVSARVKDDGSFEAKLRKDPWRGDPFHPIEDGLGLRIVAAFESDLPWIERLIRDSWEVDDESWVDKSESLAPSEFGYRSIQFIAYLPEEHQQFGLPAGLFPKRGQRVEVQLRTALSDVWSELEHDLRYKREEERTWESDHMWGLTSALIEQADANLSQIRDGVSAGLPRRTPDIGSPVVRFIQSHRGSKLLDVEISKSLDIPFETVFKSHREVENAAWNFAGWKTWLDLEIALKEYGRLGRRFATVVAHPDHGLILTDSEPHHPALAFRGVGLYFTAMAVALLNGGVGPRFQPGEFELSKHSSVPNGRLAEYLVVAQHLVDHPDESALSVRRKYWDTAAPVQLVRKPDHFSLIALS